MSLDPGEARMWSDEVLLREYENKKATLAALVGWLYTSIVEYDIGVIEAVARERSDIPIVRWRDYRVVPSTWTDEHGVVHVWESPGECIYGKSPKADHPMKTPTCLRCVVRP